MLGVIFGKAPQPREPLDFPPTASCVSGARRSHRYYGGFSAGIKVLKVRRQCYVAAISGFKHMELKCLQHEAHCLLNRVRRKGKRYNFCLNL